MNPECWCGEAEVEENVRRQRDLYARAIANVTVYTSDRTDITGEEIAALLRGDIPERLRSTP